MKRLFMPVVLLLVLSACADSGSMGPMGDHGVTQNFHHTEIPEPYAGMENSIEADEASITRGQEIYSDYCAECHGDGGMGDGPNSEMLNPAPAPLAHTSRMMSDAYFFWRISEGGAAAGTGMLSFKDKLGEEEIWDIINYLRALGQGEAMPSESGMGGEMYDPEFERKHHEEMLAEAIEEELIDQVQADNFMLVHDALDQYMEDNDLRPGTESVDEMQPEIFVTLVEAGTLAQEQVDSFNAVHQLLIDEGFMQ